MKPYVRAMFAAGILLSASIAAAEPKWISIFPSGNEAILRDEGADVWTRQADCIIGTAADSAIERLSQRGITPLAEIQDQGQSIYMLHHRPGFVPPVRRPRRRAARILSRVRSAVICRSNCANVSRMLSVTSPIGVKVSNRWLTEPKLTPRFLKKSSIWRKSSIDRDRRSNL